MNHYPRHVGDYLKKTLGLTLIQDGAYTRAIDWYYAHEGPLPHKPAVYGELRCQSKADRDTVDIVLARYFVESPQGYRHGRCDEEIERYRESQSVTDEKKENEKERQRRHRERRKELFNALRERGIVPAWDTPTTELERHVTRLSRTCHAPVTRTATANQNQNQNQKKPTEGREQSEPRRAPARKARGSRLDPAWELPEDWCQWAVTERAWTPQEAQRVAAEFRDYWLGKGETRADWQATWRNWVRRERTRSSNGNARHEPRQRVAAAIFPTGDDNAGPTERVIDGEARRIA